MLLYNMIFSVYGCLLKCRKPRWKTKFINIYRFWNLPAYNQYITCFTARAPIWYLKKKLRFYRKENVNVERVIKINLNSWLEVFEKAFAERRRNLKWYNFFSSGSFCRRSWNLNYFLPGLFAEGTCICSRRRSKIKRARNSLDPIVRLF